MDENIMLLNYSIKYEKKISHLEYSMVLEFFKEKCAMEFKRGLGYYRFNTCAIISEYKDQRLSLEIRAPWEGLPLDTLTIILGVMKNGK